MITIRPAEIVQQETERQAKFDEIIAYQLHVENQREGSLYAEQVEDLRNFARRLKRNLPENTILLVNPQPKLQIVCLLDDKTEATVSFWNTGFAYEVNDDIEMDEKLELVDRVRAGRRLIEAWLAVVAELPENFIIKGIVDNHDGEDKFGIRTRIAKFLGFLEPAADQSVYTMVQADHTLKGITQQQFLSLTAFDPRNFSTQRFETKKIDWPGQLN